MAEEGEIDRGYRKKMMYSVVVLVVIFVMLLIILPYSKSSVEPKKTYEAPMETAEIVDEVNNENIITENISISIELNEAVFYSEDLMIINVTIESPQDYEDELRLRVDGIKAGPFEKLDEYEDVYVDAGTQNIILEYDVPRCYGCSGIDPGMYNMTATLSIKKTVLASDFIEFEIAE